MQDRMVDMLRLNGVIGVVGMADGHDGDGGPISMFLVTADGIAHDGQSFCVQEDGGHESMCPGTGPYEGQLNGHELSDVVRLWTGKCFNATFPYYGTGRRERFDSYHVSLPVSGEVAVAKMGGGDIDEAARTLMASVSAHDGLHVPGLQPVQP